MRKNGILPLKVAGFIITAALLAGCYAPLANQDGYLSFDLRFAQPRLPGASEVVVLVVNAEYENSFKELLYLVDKGDETGSLSGSETDRLVELATQMATSGLVKFGGYPFYHTVMSGASGSFEIPGVPAGRDYLVKLFVFQEGHSFAVEDIDANFGALIQSENLVFSNNEDYPSAFESWVPLAGQPVTVKAGEAVSLNVTLGPRV